jgi:outer membrane lipoprotein SlyB
MALLTFAGCAGDDPSRRHAPTPAARYQADLEACESSAFSAKAAGGAEGFLTGALVGAASGAVIGAHKGGADVGAAIGAGVGALIGFVQGLTWSDRASISSCMRHKGYGRA